VQAGLTVRDGEVQLKLLEAAVTVETAHQPANQPSTKI